MLGLGLPMAEGDFAYLGMGKKEPGWNWSGEGKGRVTVIRFTRSDERLIGSQKQEHVDSQRSRAV